MTKKTTPRGQQTRARLLTAAKSALVEGDGEMSHADVAARAGLSAGAPYRYFPSKSSLIVAVVETFFDEMEARVYIPTFEEEGADWWAREKIRIARMVDFFFDDPLGGLIVSGIAGDAEVSQAHRRRLDRQSRGAGQNVARGQAQGFADPTLDPAVAGAFLMGGVYQSISVSLASNGPDRAALTVSLQGFMARVLAIREDRDET